MSTPLLIARTLDNELSLLPAMANRHGLITGATGTGKTVTLQKLAESFSRIGVPCHQAWRHCNSAHPGQQRARTACDVLLCLPYIKELK